MLYRILWCARACWPGPWLLECSSPSGLAQPATAGAIGAQGDVRTHRALGLLLVDRAKAGGRDRSAAVACGGCHWQVCHTKPGGSHEKGSVVDGNKRGCGCLWPNLVVCYHARKRGALGGGTCASRGCMGVQQGVNGGVWLTGDWDR